jgi:hypothetical protein
MLGVERKDWSHIFTHIIYSAVQILVQILTAYLKCNFVVWSSAARGVEGTVLNPYLANVQNIVSF